MCFEVKKNTSPHPSKMELLFQTALNSRSPLVAILDRKRVLPAIPGDTLVNVLTDLEREHIAQLQTEHVRSRYLAGRAVLRLLIASAAGSPPPNQLFSNGDEGAPLVVECADGGGLTFSVSHSGHYSLFGFSKAGRIGVDIEAMRPVRQILDAAEYAFSRAEAEWLRSLPEDTALPAFIRTWTRKEAVIKSLGGSVAHDMHRFSVPLGAARGCFTVSPHLSDETGDLQLADLKLKKGFRGAVCWEGVLERMRVHVISSGFLLRGVHRISLS